MKKKFNLFLNTRHLENREEDHQTEFFAALLLTSPLFRKGFEKLVLSHFFKKQHKQNPKDGWNKAHIVDVETQSQYDAEHSRPDMILHLSNGKKIVVENKISATEVVMEASDEQAQIKQLEKYLKLPDISGVAYIRANWKAPDASVLKHPKYIKPLKYEHFLWRDFFPLLRKDKTALGEWITEAFAHKGYTPPVAQIGDMSRQFDEECIKNRENYKKFLDETYRLARELGWKTEASCIEGLWCGNNPKSTCEQLMFTASQPERFLVRVTPKDGQYIQVKDKLKATVSLLKDVDVEIHNDAANRVQNKKKPVILLTTTLREILGKAKGEKAIRSRLSSFYGTILMALQEE
jgi:uncharacterized protein YlzI (FlbEa/FlbD family)